MLDRTRFEHEMAALRECGEDGRGRPAESHYLPIARNATLKGRVTGAFVPCAARTAKTIDVIVYFHGFVETCRGDLAKFGKRGMEYYWSVAPFDKLRSRLDASGRAAVLIAPTLHEWVGARSSGSDRGGDLHEKNRLDKLIGTVLDELKNRKAIDAGAAIGNIVLAAHSGGGKPMHDAIGATNALRPKIRACWGFECVYYGTSNYVRWLKADSSLRFRHFREQNVQSAHVAPLAKLTNFIDTTTTTKKAHCGLVDEFWDSLLGTLPATAGDVKASFELAAPMAARTARLQGWRRSGGGKAA